MAFWNRNKNWEDEYDEHYAQDRRSGQPRGRSKYWFVPHVLTLAFVGFLFVGAVGMISGQTMVEKLLTQLASPVGIVWMTLILLVYFSLLTRQAWPAVIGFFCWLVLTVGGNKIVANWLITTLEAPYQQIDLLEQDPYDTVVVLGGGTNTTVGGQAQLTMDGDRIATAAKLYHAGIAKRIVCTGSQKFRSTPKDLHPREEARDILKGLNVAGSDILMMQGENTFQEMQNLRTWIDENAPNERVGILTSAWHLPRAMRLAESNGLDVHPIPSNFISEHYSPGPSVIVPGAYDLTITTRACKEYLASLVGR